MFDQLFKQPAALARHQDAPFAAERVAYLAACADSGAAHATLVRVARELLVIVRQLDFTGNHRIGQTAIEVAAERWARQQYRRHRSRTLYWSRLTFCQTAVAWLRFLDRLDSPAAAAPPFATLVTHFVTDLRERGLSRTTITNYQWHLQRFLSDFSARRCPFSHVRVEDVDGFLARQGAHWCRVSLASSGKALRAFFRYAEGQDWCRPGIAAAIETPRVFRDESLPAGPAWDEVARLIRATDTPARRDIRDRAILLLLAVYGLRSGEVARLRLEDLDWTHEHMTVTRTKCHHLQRYPLTGTVGDAIVRYLQEVRPRCSRREVFLTLKAPLRPLSPGGLYHVTRSRFDALNIPTPHRGPHALRHACACHLLAEGLSLDAIGNHLGHRDLSSTRHYAKVDLTGLREVARFDVGGLL